MQCRGFLPIPNFTAEYASTLKHVYESYYPFHPYISLTLCSVGIIFNTGNLVILNHKTMRTPVNTVLSWVVTCHIILHAIHLTQATNTRLKTDCELFHVQLSYAWTIFSVVYGNLSTVLHTCGLWLTALVAVLRCATVNSAKSFRRSQKRHLSLSLSSRKLYPNTYPKCIALVATVVVANVPGYLTLTVRSKPVPELAWNQNPCNVQTNASIFYPEYTLMAVRDDCLLLKIMYWSTSVCQKLLPTCCLAVATCFLVYKLVKFKHRRNRLGKAQDRDITTFLLLFIIIIAFLTEVPQGLLAMGVALYGEEFNSTVYRPLGDFIDLLALVNGSLSVFVYCSMSSAFRRHARTLVCCKNTPATSVALARTLRT